MKLDVNDESLRIRYLNRQLSPEEETWFEEHLMEDPELLAQLQTTQIMLESVSETAFASGNTEKGKDLRTKLSAPVFSFPLGVLTGLAASALLTLGIFTQPALEVHTSPNVMFLETSRGAAAPETEVRLDKDNRAILFVQTGGIEPTGYLMQLIAPASQHVLKTEQVTANAAGELVLLIDFSGVQASRVDLVLTNTNNDKKDVHKLSILRP